jgi:hypothetical protein
MDHTATQIVPDWNFETLVSSWHESLLDTNMARGIENLSAIEDEWRYREIDINLEAECPWEGLTDNPSQGLLSVLGYHVGITQSQPPKLRHKILQRIVVAELPIVYSQSYMLEWGKPNSLKRKAKTISTISRFIEQKSTYKVYGQAVEIWMQDLRVIEGILHPNHSNFYFNTPYRKQAHTVWAKWFMSKFGKHDNNAIASYNG